MSGMQTFFTALADRTRRRLLNLMREHEICVCYFTEVLDVSQPKISRHLAYLRNAGIVVARREGKWIYYRIVKQEDFYAAQILQETLEWLKDDERMRKDYEKLIMICASPNVPITITRAPKPNILQATKMPYEEREEMETLNLLKSQERMQKDYEKLMLVCTLSNISITISHAPKPNILRKTNMHFSLREELETFLL